MVPTKILYHKIYSLYISYYITISINTYFKKTTPALSGTIYSSYWCCSQPWIRPHMSPKDSHMYPMLLKKSLKKSWVGHFWVCIPIFRWSSEAQQMVVGIHVKLTVFLGFNTDVALLDRKLPMISPLLLDSN